MKRILLRYKQIIIENQEYHNTANLL